MRERLRRGMRWLMLVLTGSILFQAAAIPTVAWTGNAGAYGGCNRFITNGLLTPVDFCYILDCQNGFLGGAVQPCGTSDMLVDCPSTGTTTGTTTGT